MKLIIGASGYIGKNIYNSFSKNEKVIGTYHKNWKEGLIYFNLENPNLENLDIDLKSVSYALICSSITKPDDCKKNEDNSYKVNVEGTTKLIQQLFQKRIVPVFFSSEYVFDGKKGNYTESDKTAPNTIYGIQKKEIENLLLQTKKESLILRLSKVFGLERGDGTILTSTIDQLKRNEKIKCATDQIFSPIYIWDLVNALELALDKKLNGLYNLASPEHFSRYELSMLLKSELKLDSGEILPCSIRDFNFLESRPLNTSLNIEKFINETGFEFTRMKDCISKLEKIIG